MRQSQSKPPPQERNEFPRSWEKSKRVLFLGLNIPNVRSPPRNTIQKIKYAHLPHLHNHRSPDSTSTQRSLREPTGQPKCMHMSHLHNPSLREPTGHPSLKKPSFTRPLVIIYSETMPLRRRKTSQCLHRPTQVCPTLGQRFLSEVKAA
jgi:hypothetical protein